VVYVTSPETATPAAPATPEATRTCRKCDETKVVTPESWPHRKNKKGVALPEGQVCLPCETARKAEYKARVRQLAADVKPSASNPSGKPDDERKAITAVSKLDAALALKTGSRALNEAAPGIVTRLLMWAEDETHPQHVFAVEFLAQRVMPRKLFEELGGQAAGVGSLADKRPQFVIQVLPAQQPAPPGDTARVIEGQHEIVEVKQIEGAKNE
jgi:hypothetical protein